MGLLDALQIGGNALMAHQAALQITGNNITNSATPGYARQVPMLSATGETRYGNGVRGGAGVQLTDIRRMMDQALEERIHDANGQTARYQVADQTLNRLESIMNELTDTDLSTAMTQFFNKWSQLAQSPQDPAQRGIVLQGAISLTGQFNQMRSSMEDLRQDLGEQLEGAVKEADRLAGAIADLNVQIVSAESGGATAASLRDQRDRNLSELSQMIGISTREDANGSVNVFVGSEPLVYNGDSRGLEMINQTVNGQTQKVISFSDNQCQATLSGGKIMGLQATRDGELSQAISRLDSLANQMIWQVNSIHANGAGLEGFPTATGTYGVKDQASALNSAAAGLVFKPVNGSFNISVTTTVGGQPTTLTRQINVNLAGAATDTTLNSLVASLNTVAGVSASVNALGQLKIDTSTSGARINFSKDTSGTLASLGINTFFTGSGAGDIRLNPVFDNNDTGRIAAGLCVDGKVQPGDGETAGRIASLAKSPIASLNDLSLLEYHQGLVNDVAVWTAGARDAATSSGVVQDSLNAQHESVSGVSTDEEAVNLMRYQRAFQGSARLISVVNELLDTLMKLV